MAHDTEAGHDKHCGAATRSGGKCKRPAGWGTEHSGVGRCKLHGGATPNHEKSAAMATARIMGEEMDIEPHEALLWCVRLAAGEIKYATTQIAGLEQATESTAFGAKLNIWIEVRQRASERLASFSKMALAAGVAERQVALAERYGDMIATLVGGILGDLKLTAGQQKKAPAVVRRHMALLEAGPPAG